MMFEILTLASCVTTAAGGTGVLDRPIGVEFDNATADVDFEYIFVGACAFYSGILGISKT
jgi:hypothetical protein